MDADRMAGRHHGLRPREPKVALALAAPLFAWGARAALRHVVSRLADADLDDALLSSAHTLGASDS